MLRCAVLRRAAAAAPVTRTRATSAAFVALSDCADNNNGRRCTAQRRSTTLLQLQQQQQLSCAVLHVQRRWCSSSSNSSSSAPPDMSPDDAIKTSEQRGDTTVSFDRVWALWNEGNLFSLSVAQMQQFLRGAGVSLDGVAPKKASLVRLLEEHLHARDASGGVVSGGGSGAAGAAGDAAANNTNASSVAATTAAAAAAAASSVAAGTASRPVPYGRWAAGGARGVQPETLLDLAQSGFYEGAAHMAPKAFQLLIRGSAAEMVISRVNTTAFPGFPANTECYTLVASDAEVALRARFSKVLQWCALNMSSLHMDGELHVTFGTLLLHPRAARGPMPAAATAAGVVTASAPAIGAAVHEVVSTYTLQQRLQLHRPYTFVAALPEAARAAALTFLSQEGFVCVSPPSSSSSSQQQQQTSSSSRAQLTYEGVIQRAKERLFVELDEHAKLRTLHREWVDVQTVYHTDGNGPDVRLLLRSRPPVRQHDVQLYASMPIVQLTDDDVVDVLPAEHGQLLYLSENETTRYECVSARGTVIVLTEVRRQPLIVLHDDEEDARLEYALQVQLPAGATAGQTGDARGIGLEVLELARRFAQAVAQPYFAEYGCGVQRDNSSSSGSSSSSTAATAAATTSNSSSGASQVQQEA